LTRFNIPSRLKKKLSELEIEGTYLKILKAKYEKLTANIVLNREKLKIFL
jgi:hypothetical protein